MYKLYLEKTEEPEIKLPTLVGSQKKQGNLKKIHFSFIDYTKAFECVDQNKLKKILKEMGITDHLTCLLRNLYAGQDAAVRTGHATKDWVKIGKGVHQGQVNQAVYGHLVYLTYMQSTLCKMQGWMKLKLQSRMLGEKYTSDMQMIPP